MEKSIEERNRRVESGNGGSDFFVDEGLLLKVNSLFEIPSVDEIDVRYVRDGLTERSVPSV